MSTSFELPPGNGAKVCVGGGAGFIGSHIAKRLKAAGYHVTVVDWKKNEFMEEPEFCDVFIHDDLRKLEVAVKACHGCKQVYNLAADMGGMGFIVSNESVLAFNNTAISMNMLEAARRANAERFFYASSACVYNEAKQEDPANPGLIEADAWPARPQDMYGLGKALRGGNGPGLRTRLSHQDSHRPFPQHLRTAGDLEGRPRKGARRLLPQGPHLDGSFRNVGRRQADPQFHLY